MEFKKLSDVEVVETVSDSANVLIEENGVIKKVPKSQVGGNVSDGSVSSNAGLSIIVCVENYNFQVVSAPDNLYEVIEKMFNEGAIVPLNIYTCEFQDGECTHIDQWKLSIHKYSDRFEIQSDNYTCSVMNIYSNGNIECFGVD